MGYITNHSNVVKKYIVASGKSLFPWWIVVSCPYTTAALTVAALKLMASAVQRLLCIVVKKRKEIRHWSPDRPTMGQDQKDPKGIEMYKFHVFFTHFNKIKFKTINLTPACRSLLGSDGPCFHQCHGHVDHDLYPHVKSAMHLVINMACWKAPFMDVPSLKTSSMASELQHPIFARLLRMHSGQYWSSPCLKDGYHEVPSYSMNIPFIPEVK